VTKKEADRLTELLGDLKIQGDTGNDTFLLTIPVDSWFDLISFVRENYYKEKRKDPDV